MSSIQQILRLGYLQESNRTQWYYLERKDKWCILLDCWAAGQAHSTIHNPFPA